MAAQELARWTRFAAKGGVGRCTATVDCVAREIGDLMFLKDDEITVLMQLPEAGYYLGFCEGVVGRFSGTDVKFHGKLKRPIMAKRGSLGVADTRPMSLERASPSWPESSSGARAGSSNANRPGSSVARADSASDSRPGSSPVRRKPLSPDMYLYSSSPERLREYERTRGRAQELTASVSVSSAYSAVSTSSAASTTFSDGDEWRSSEDSFLSSAVVPSSSSGSVQASSSTKSVPTSFSSMDSVLTSSSNPTPATSSVHSIPSLSSTHTSSAGSVEKLLQSLSNHSPSMSQSTSGSISASASESMSGTFLNSSSTYGSLTSAPTSNSSSSSTNFATSAPKGLTVAPLRLNKSPRLTASPMSPPLSPLLPLPGSGTTSRAYSPLPPRSPRSPLLASFTLPAKSSPPRSPLPLTPPEIPQSPPSPPSTASSAPESNSDADDSSLYLDDDNDHEHDESTQLSTLHRHLDGAEEEEDGETGIGLSLLGALAMDDDDDEDDESDDRPWLEVEAGGKDRHGLGDREGESTATSGSTPIPWTQYTPSISASPTVEHKADDNAPHALSENETAQDDSTMQDEPEQHLKREGEVGDEAEEDEDEDEEGYWARASDIYDDYRYSRYSLSSKRMSTISVKSKAHMSILSGGGKVPPVPSFSPDRPTFSPDKPSFDALTRPSVSSGRPSVSSGRPSVSSGRPSVSSASSPNQIDRANIPSTYTDATASVYSRPSFESTSSTDPGSPVSFEHAPHGPVDGPEVRLRPPVARQFSADYESTRTVSTYSVQTLSPLSAQFPQVPTGVPSRLRVMNADMENESDGDGLGLGGEKAPPHAMNPVSPLLYASFGANERHSGYTEETEMQSSGYSESDDGHASRKSRGLRSDAGSLRSPVSPTDGSSVASALRMRTESGREQRVGLGMRIVVDDDDENLGGDTSFVSSETGTASTGHTVTPVSPLPSTTGAPSTLVPRAPAALTPGSPSTPTPGASLVPVTSSALSPVASPSPGAPSALTPGNSPSGHNAPAASTLRPRQPNQALHPFSRTSIFLPHPNAPKIAPGGQGLGPMYARPQHPNASPGSIAPVQPPPNATSFSAQVLRHLRSISLGPGVGAGVRGPPKTLYARCEPDLNSSAGPVPIMFSMDPLPPLQARMAHPGITVPPSVAPVPPIRAATVSAPVRRSSAASAAVGPLRGVPPPSSAKDTSPNPSADPNSTSALRLPRRSAATLAGVQEQSTSGSVPVAPISRPNFVPQVGAARPRSRSFSGFGEAVNVGALPERSREEPVSKSISVTAASVSTPSPTLQPAPTSAPTPNGLPTSLRARHIPSPLSLQNGNLSRERSLNTVVSSTDTPSPNAGQLKSPITPGFQQPSPIPSVTKFGLQPPSAGSSSASPVPSFSPSNLSDRDKDASPASAMTGRTSVSTNNVASPHPWVTNVRHGSLDIPRKNSVDGTPPRQSSDSTDSRSQMASPPPIVEWHSQSARSSPLAHEVQLRGKLSLPALRGRTSIKSKLDDAVSVTSSLGNQESETVQVQDMDFELVKPTLPQVPLGRSSQESSYAGRDADAVYLDSPGIVQGDAASMHSSAPRSPMFPDAISSGTPPVESPMSIDAHRQREVKWMALLPIVPPSQARRNKKVKRLLLDGVPSSVRYLVWCHLSDSKARAIPGVYTQLGKRQRVPAFSDIEKDAKKYFPDQTQLHPFDGPLVSLLQAYLNMVPDIQYSSGLTSIAGHLLLLSPEEDAFWIFASMMDAHLRPYFSANTIQLEVDAALLSKAIEANDSAVCKKLYVTFSIPPGAIAKSWFSTLFVGTLPVEYLHRIWDVFLYEGVTLLFRVGLALVQCVRHLLLQSTSEEAAMEYLVHPPLACLPSTADAFLNQALMMKLKDDDVRKQRIKMEAQIKRQTQSRTTNGSSGMQTASISLPKTS